jgi:hypothetical protein
MKPIATHQSRCHAGVARGEITPLVGIYHRMWGAAVHDRSTGVHRPLTATALYLKSLNEDGPPAQVMIAVDHCLLWPTEMNQLLDSVSQATGLGRDSLVVFFSHTHAAGLMGLERKDLPGGELIEPYLAELSIKIAELVNEAQRQPVVARIVYGRGLCSLATHRDFYDFDRGYYVCGYNPSGEVDTTVVVGRITAESGELLATLVNYACHPTTLAWDNTLISPDYPGAMREVVEAVTHVPCLFIQGASGDVGPREGFVGDVEVADRNGRQLGYAALAAFEALPPVGNEFVYLGPVVSGATIGTWGYVPESVARIAQAAKWITHRKTISLAYRSDLPSKAELEQEELQFRAEEQSAIEQGDSERARDARAMIERTTRRMIRIAPLPAGDFYPYTILLWRMGDAIWIALDGEHYNWLQQVLRARFPQFTLIIGTLANGSKSWYLPTKDNYGLGLYQEEVSVLAEGCLEAVVEWTTIEIQKFVGLDS